MCEAAFCQTILCQLGSHWCQNRQAVQSLTSYLVSFIRRIRVVLSNPQVKRPWKRNIELLGSNMFQCMQSVNKPAPICANAVQSGWRTVCQEGGNRMTIGPTTGANKAKTGKKNGKSLTMETRISHYQPPAPEAIPKRVASLLRAMHILFSASNPGSVDSLSKQAGIRTRTHK